MLKPHLSRYWLTNERGKNPERFDREAIDTPLRSTDLGLPTKAGAPTLGNTPSDNPLDFSPPQSLDPERPNPITGGTEPIVNTAPPIGWESEEANVNVFDTDVITCAKDHFYEDGQCKLKKDLKKETSATEGEICLVVSDCLNTNKK